MDHNAETVPGHDSACEREYTKEGYLFIDCLRYSRAAKAEAWDAALDFVWALSDPAYTILACVDPARDESEAYLELVTAGDIGQAKRQNPYRVTPPTRTGADS